MAASHGLLATTLLSCILIHLYGLQGMKRLYADIHDINVDVPAAYTLLDTLANKLHSKHVLEDSLMKDLPSRYTLLVVIICCM